MLHESPVLCRTECGGIVGGERSFELVETVDVTTSRGLVVPAPRSWHSVVTQIVRRQSKESTARGGGFHDKPQRGVKCLASGGGKDLSVVAG